MARTQPRTGNVVRPLGRPDTADPRAALEQQLAEHRLLRAGLTRDLAAITDRLDRLEHDLRQGHGRPDAPADEAEALRDHVRHVEGELAAAQARIRYLERRVVELQGRDGTERAPTFVAPAPVPSEGPQPDLVLHRLDRRPSNQVLAGAAAALLLAAGLGAGITAAVSGGDSAAAQGPRLPAPAVAGPAAPAADLPPCAAVGTPAKSTTCTTGTELTMASGTNPVVMDGFALRALAARNTRAGAVVRLRMRDLGPAPDGVRPGPRQLYLALGGRRLYGKQDAVRAGALTQNFTLTVPLDAAARRALARAGNKVDLGVLPFTAKSAGKASRRGVIKLTLGRPPS